jgi:hypothetical protein
VTARPVLSLLVFGSLGLGALSLDACAGRTKPPSGPPEVVGFQHRVGEYVELQNKAEKALPPLPKAAEPEQIQARTTDLAKRIREFRGGAQRGDLFTPDVSAYIQKAMRDQLAGPAGATERSALALDRPGSKDVPLVVNGDYPSDEAFSTMTPAVLAALPAVPQGVDYRFVGRTLILRSVPANLIVDFLPVAIPAK